MHFLILLELFYFYFFSPLLLYFGMCMSFTDGTAAFSAGSNRKLRRVRNTMSDSDSETCLTLNSEREDQSQNESKGRRRSRRDGAKETVKQIKKKNDAKLLKKKEIKQNPNNSEEAVQISQNDSALPFADSDLFDRELSDGEEDSVNAIKALVKNKVLKSKKDPPKRAERKAAKVSKAALQQIHSETQRLIRESNTSLPYHLPEPKTIHDFFKRRSHQPGNSGISSRYSKTQPNSLTNDVNLSGDFHLVSTTEGTPDKPELSATPEANNENMGVQACVSIEVLEESGNFQEERNGNFTEAADQHFIEPSHGPLLAAVIETPDKTGDECATSNNKTSAENVACSNTSNGGDKQVNVVSAVHSLLEKPKTLGVDFTVQPRISAPANNFIDLTEVPNTGMEKFQQRFLRHVVASANPPAGNGKQETDKLAGERSMENALTSSHASLREKPGAGRLLLKAKLREEMRKRRETERCRRWEAYNKETGKGFEEDVEEEEEVPDLGEKCDRTNDSDLELDPELKTSKDEGRKEESFHFETAESLQQEDDLENLSMLPANEGHSRKIYPTISEASLVLFEHTNSGSHIQSFEGSIRLGECGQEELCADSDEEHGYGHDSSFDLSSSTIPPYQPLACSQANSNFRSPSPNLVSPLSQYQIPCGSSVTMSSGKCSEIQLPVENSQDLYQMSLDPILGLGASQAGDLNFRFSLNEDMDSETCGPTTDRLVERFHMPNSKRKLNLESLEENAMDGNMDELLVLCSGSFPSPCDERDSRSAEVLPSKIMDISIDEGEGGMSELLELCSGKFPSQESRLWNSSTKMCDVEKVADTGQTDSKTSLHAET
uniref:Uncharacterized protein n=1 Tax=Eptatretus burgeri TaxID=7764 RepID=A0A8C4WXL3_EPTBU